MKKSELVEILEEERQELQEMLEDLPDEALLEPGVVPGWSIKDILNHLTYWEGQTVTLLFQVLRGIEKPTTVHFQKESADTLNQRWFETGRERPLEMVWNDWVGVRKQTIRRVTEMNEKDLNNSQRFAWLKGVPLYQWILNDTVEHESEHADQIRDWIEKRDDHSASSNGHSGG